MGDMVVTVSGSGTAPFLLDILYYAVENSPITHYSIFCNPYEQLKERCKNSKIFENQEYNKRINWFTVPCGPMSITGSTRLQATLLMTIVFGCLVMDYDYKEILTEIISELDKIDFNSLD